MKEYLSTQITMEAGYKYKAAPILLLSTIPPTQSKSIMLFLNSVDWIKLLTQEKIKFENYVTWTSRIEGSNIFNLVVAIQFSTSLTIGQTSNIAIPFLCAVLCDAEFFKRQWLAE